MKDIKGRAVEQKSGGEGSGSNGQKGEYKPGGW